MSISWPTFGVGVVIVVVAIVRVDADGGRANIFCSTREVPIVMDDVANRQAGNTKNSQRCN